MDNLPENDDKIYGLTLGSEVMQDVEWMAERHGCSITDVFRRSLATEKYLLEASETDHILLKRPRFGIKLGNLAPFGYNIREFNPT